METEEYIDKLKAILEKNIELHEVLIDRGQELYDATIKRDTLLVAQATERFDSLIEKVEQIERDRLAICISISKQHNVNCANITLREVIKLLSKKHQESLNTLRYRLKERVSKLSGITNSIHLLLLENLKVIRSNFEIRTAIDTADLKPYSKKSMNTKNKVKLRKTLINKIA